LAAIAALEPAAAARVAKPNFPLHLREVMSVASWWLLREIELAAVTLQQVTFLPGAGCGLAVIDLPVSKADPMAHGKVRSLSCACPSPACPVVALRTLWRHAQQRLEARPDETSSPVSASCTTTLQAEVDESTPATSGISARRGAVR
jgi:hypothetical protein